MVALTYTQVSMGRHEQKKIFLLHYCGQIFFLQFILTIKKHDWDMVALTYTQVSMERHEQ